MNIVAKANIGKLREEINESPTCHLKQSFHQGRRWKPKIKFNYKSTTWSNSRNFTSLQTFHAHTHKHNHATTKTQPQKHNHTTTKTHNHTTTKTQPHHHKNAQAHTHTKTYTRTNAHTTHKDRKINMSQQFSNNGPPQSTPKCSLYHSFKPKVWPSPGCSASLKYPFYDSFERPTGTKWREGCTATFSFSPTLC